MNRQRPYVPEELLSNLSELLMDTMGLYFPKEGWPGLEKKFASVVTAFGFEDPKSCLDWLLRAPLTQEQIAILARYLTVGETYFFRDSHIFHCLEHQILPDLIRDREKTSRSLRIWCAACCTGEEPYSVAMLLHRLLPDLEDWKISILGTDINPHFLKKAEAGHYKEWSFRATPENMRTLYFTKEKSGTYLLSPIIRHMVKFQFLNLAEDCYPSLVNGTNAMDLIICNNVLIYFSHKQIKRVVKHLVSSLVEEGRLIVTPIETPYIQDPRIIPLHHSNVTYFVKGGDQQKSEMVVEEQVPFPIQTVEPLTSPIPALFQIEAPPLELPAMPYVEETPSVKIERRDSKESPLKKCLELYMQGDYSEIIFLLGAYLGEHLLSQNDAQEIILISRAYANLGNLAEAKRWCEIAIGLDKLDPSFHFLHATILQEFDQLPEAIQSLKKTLFLDKDFVMAHFAIANLYHQQHNHQGAKRHLRNAKQLLQQHQPEDILQGEEGITAGRLSEIIESIQNLDEGHAV